MKDPMQKVFRLTVSRDNRTNMTIVHLWRRGMVSKVGYVWEMPKYVQKFLNSNYNMPSYVRYEPAINATFYTWLFN